MCLEIVACVFVGFLLVSPRNPTPKGVLSENDRHRAGDPESSSDGDLVS